MDRFVDAKIQSGWYSDASEVLRACLRALEQDDKENQARLDALRTAVQAGIDRVRARIRRRAEGLYSGICG